MAEFCKDCYLAKLADNKELKANELGLLEIELSKDTDYCEGCCDIKPIVERVYIVTK